MARNDVPIGELFDDLADEYLEVREAVGWDPWPHVKAAFGEGPLAGWRILDVGCGSGEVSAGLAARGAELAGVDASERMCELASEAVPGAPFLWHDLNEGLPFGDDSFDGVLALGCIEYVANVEMACSELVRVTRPGGIVLYAVELCEEGLCGGPTRHFRLYDEWTRYRRTYAEIEAKARDLLQTPRLARIPAYIFDDTGEQVGYVRVIGTA